jgi:hypothetical protein
MLGTEVQERSISAHARVCDEDVEAAETVDCCSDDRLHLCSLPDIARLRDGVGEPEVGAAA